jgi:hypothetical protein
MTQLLSRAWIDAHPANILELDRPDEATCVVERYHAGHPTLDLNIYRSAVHSPAHLALKVVFSSVHFFAGPTSWRGANLCQAPYHKNRQFLHQLGWLENVPAEIIAELVAELRLFTIRAVKPPYQILIVAANILVSRSSTPQAL